MTKSEQILTVDEVGRLLRIDEQTVQQLLQTADLAGFRVGAEWRIPFAAVLEYMRRGMEQAQINALSRAFSDPRAWARTVATEPALRQEIEDGEFEPDSMGKFLQEAVHLSEGEQSGEVIPLRPNRD